MAKIQIPENYQDALTRKEEVLKLINAYKNKGNFLLSKIYLYFVQGICHHVVI